MSGIQPLDMKVVSKLMRYCAYRERSKKEVIQKLQSLGVGFSDPYLDYLTNNNYLNFSRYAHAFALGKFRINKWGKQKIKQALHLNGVDHDLINTAVSSINDEDYTITLNSLAKNKLKDIKGKNEFEIRSKASRYLISKGYEPELIKQALDGLLKD
ncbi:MAG: hypothetical protein CL853_00245 [Crocinitomicaceae bacterium]|nr:hypothetical protein [Crocinitomicaceae bacterium]|tara:strand:- start:1873 stop:2340 length:468 start_codon:yes stop_codon:yes gene_type:complete